MKKFAVIAVAAALWGNMRNYGKTVTALDEGGFAAGGLHPKWPLNIMGQGFLTTGVLWAVE